MSDADHLRERIEVLETRLTFQDEAIETLNKTITAQWLKIDTLTRQLEALSERLRLRRYRTGFHPQDSAERFPSCFLISHPPFPSFLSQSHRPSDYQTAVVATSARNG